MRRLDKRQFDHSRLEEGDERRDDQTDQLRRLRVWRALRENVGVCCRCAPESTTIADEVAHWPQTRSWQWCGERDAAPSLSVATRCAGCAFWRQPEGGLNPLNRGDMPMSWWARAGVCARHAPRPVSEPRPRAFWRHPGRGLLRRGRAAQTCRGVVGATSRRAASQRTAADYGYFSKENLVYRFCCV